MININDKRPTKPLAPNWFTISIKFVMMFIPNTDVPVNSVHRIVTGTIAIITDTNPAKNPVKYFITLSIIVYCFKLILKFKANT